MLRATLGSFQAFFRKELCQRFPRAECEVTQSSKSVVTDHATRTGGIQNASCNRQSISEDSTYYVEAMSVTTRGGRLISYLIPRPPEHCGLFFSRGKLCGYCNAELLDTLTPLDEL